MRIHLYHKILYKKIREQICQSPTLPSSEWSYGALKNAMFEIMEWKSRFTLAMNTAKNTNYIKEVSNKNCLEFNFLQKLSGCICLSVSGVEVGAPNIWHCNFIKSSI